MIKRIFVYSCCLLLTSSAALTAHCQMPCGIYHDDMVFDQVDQYIETLVKGISVLEKNKFSTPQERNEGVRWVLQKEKSSDEIAELMTSYFLQQKIKPNEPETAKKLLSAHKLLFLIVQIKQTVNLEIANEFYQEWEQFKLMFHIEGYKCKVNHAKLKKWREKNQLPPNGEEQEEEDHLHTHEDGTTHSHD